MDVKFFFERYNWWKLDRYSKHDASMPKAEKNNMVVHASGINCIKVNNL